MQAQPQSNLAARIPASPLSPRTPLAAIPSASPRPPSLAETSGLAHDAGNLLAALGLYSDLLSVPGVLRPEHKHYATELRLISDRSATLIRRLLDAPVTSTPTTLLLRDTIPVRLSKLFHRRNTRTSDHLANTPNHAATLLSLAPVLQRIAAGAAAVTVTCPVSLPPLNFPSEVIERIAVNLVRNAAEAIRHRHANLPSTPLPPSGEIHVSLAVTGGRLQLIIEDNGPGMSPSNVEAYLNPQPLPQGANHGLGHRIVHELATASQGQLSIRVRPGHGTAFCLKWPIPQPSPLEACPSNLPSTPSPA